MKPSRHAIVPREILLGDTGRNILQRMIDGELPGPPIAKTLGFSLVEVGEGRAVFEGVPSVDYYNPLGTIHGGWMATLLDSAVACAIQTTLAAGEAYTTIELKLNFTRALTDKVKKVRAEGNVIHRGRSIATSEGKLVDEAGRLYAHATTTCMIFPRGMA